MKNFKEFLNEFEIEGERLVGKPLWNGIDYLDKNGNINLTDMKLTELPCVFPEKWSKSFYCDYNGLTSLYGVPREINGNFSCYYNKLTSLDGAPRKVRGDFDCRKNITEFTKLDVMNICNVEKSIFTSK